MKRWDIRIRYMNIIIEKKCVTGAEEKHGL